MDRVSAEGKAKARSVWSARGLPPLSRARKREQAHRTPNAAARYQLLAGSWSQCAVAKLWRLSMNLKRLALEMNDLGKTGSWPRFTSGFWRCPLPMNRERRNKDSLSPRGTSGEGSGRGAFLEMCE